MKRSALLVFVIAVTSICSGQWLERQVVIGDTFGGISLVDAGGIVVNPTSGNVYIESDPVQIFNPVTMQKIRGPGVAGRVVFCPPSGKGYVLGEDSLLVLDASADTAIGTTVLPFGPYRHAYSPASNRLYLGEEYEDTLLVFDPNGDSVLKSIAVGARVSSLLWDSAANRLFIGTRSDSGRLEVLDCVTNTLIAEVRLGMRDVRRLALSSVSRKLYCAGIDTSGSDGVVVVGADSLRIVDTVPGLRIPNAMAYSPVTNRLYCTGVLDDSLFAVDCTGDTIRTRLAVWVNSLAANSLSGRVYLGRADTPQVCVVGANDAIVDSIPLPTAPTMGVTALTYRRDRNEVYGVTSGDLAFVIDASSDTVTGTLNYARYLPRQMVHNPAGNKLYLLCPGFDEILVMDSAFGSPRHILGGATDNDALPVLNPVLNRLYVADYYSLRVIDCNSDSLLASERMYGISAPLPVIVPYLNRVYVFEGSGGADSVYAYDCLRNTVASILYLSDAVPSAVFDPRTNRIYFACEDAPTIRALNPVTGVIERTFDLVGGSNDGRLALNLDLGRLYYADQSPNRMFTIDLLADSVIGNESLPWDIDTMFLDRRLQKLYMCSRQHAGILVHDCSQAKVTDTIAADFHYAGLLDEINDKLYLRNGAVVDCRYDSVVATLPGASSPRSMAWDAIDNRVFQATTSWLYVYRDDPYGVDEQKDAVLGPGLIVLGNPARNAVAIRLQIPPGQTGRITVYDAMGRLAHSTSVIRTSVIRLDLGAEPAGVYFVSLEVGHTRTTDKVIVQH